VYEVYLERRAERDLKKLPGEILYRIIPTRRALSENPRPPVRGRSWDLGMIGESA
jgi:mRNA interferase RelE/StbE